MKASSYLKTAVAVSAVLFAATALSTSVQANNEFYQVTNVQYDDALNIRSGAGTNYPVIGSIPANGRTILTTGNTEQMGDSMWTEVVWLGQIGWVNNHYLSAGSQAAETQPQPVVAVQEVQPQRKNPGKIDYSSQVAAANNANSHTHPANRCTRTITHGHPNGVATHRHNYSCQKNQTQSNNNANAHTHPRNRCTNSITHNHPNGSGAHNHHYACQPGAAQQMARPKYNPRPKFNQ